MFIKVLQKGTQKSFKTPIFTKKYPQNLDLCLSFVKGGGGAGDQGPFQYLGNLIFEAIPYFPFIISKVLDFLVNKYIQYINIQVE